MVEVFPFFSAFRLSSLLPVLIAALVARSKFLSHPSILSSISAWSVWGHAGRIRLEPQLYKEQKSHSVPRFEADVPTEEEDLSVA